MYNYFYTVNAYSRMVFTCIYIYHHLNYKKKHTFQTTKKKKKPMSVGPPDHPSLPFAPFLVANLIINLIINLYATNITSLFLYYHLSHYFLSHRPILTCCIVYIMRDIKNISIYLSIYTTWVIFFTSGSKGA